jgi:hypothetical protein
VENAIKRPASLSSLDDHCERSLVIRLTLRIESKLKTTPERKHDRVQWAAGPSDARQTNG